MRKTLAFTIVLVFILAVPAAAFASGVSVNADSTSVDIGDTVTLTVIVSGEHIGVANGSFTYDPALLSYISSNGGASDGYINLVSAQKGGSSSLTVIIKFRALGAGDAEIKVSIDSLLDYNGKKLDNAEDSVSIAVASSGSPTVTGSETSKPPVDYSKTGIAAENVMGAVNQMYIWRSLDSLTMPAGFADKQVDYGGDYVSGAGIPDSEDITVLYLSEADGGNAGYYVYDQEKNILFPYLTVVSVSSNFTLIWPDENIVVPAGYEQTMFTWKGKDVPAWKAQGSDASVYLVYARNGAGDRGLYLYNAEDESVQRFIAQPEIEPAVTPEPTPAPTEQPEVTPEAAGNDTEITLDYTIFMALCGGGILMLTAVVVFAVLYGKATHGKRSAARMAKGIKKDIHVRDADI